MRNYIQPGKTITVTNSTSDTIASGDLVVIGTALIGVACAAILAGEEGEISTEGVFSLPKAPAEVIAAGDLLYHDENASPAAVLTALGDETTPLVGVCTKAAGAGVLVVNVKLGSFGLVGPSS